MIIQHTSSSQYSNGSISCDEGLSGAARFALPGMARFDNSLENDNRNSIIFFTIFPLRHGAPSNLAAIKRLSLIPTEVCFLKQKNDNEFIVKSTRPHSFLTTIGRLEKINDSAMFHQIDRPSCSSDQPALRSAKM